VILILTCVDDPTTDAVAHELARTGARVVRMDVGDFPARMGLVAEHGGDQWGARLVLDGQVVELAQVTAVYYRRPTMFSLARHLEGQAQVVAREEARLGFGGVLAAGTRGARWVNDPAMIARAEYKPLGLQIAAEVGLRIPRTLVTNDHAELVRFADELNGGGVLVKQLSAISMRDETGPLLAYSTPIDVAEVSSEDVATTAHLFQEWIDKQFEVRLTLVGGIPFAAAIHAMSERALIDWRSDYGSLRYEQISVPVEVASACVRYLEALGLRYGAFDFVVTPSGDWVMLECNPHGQWLWIEHATGLPIAAALAELLNREEGTG